jgi:hypothetical protein
MEQVFRKLIKELKNNPIVEKVTINYYEIKIKWKNGFKQRLILNKPENEFKDLSYRRSPIYNYHYMPLAYWWSDISDNKKLKPNYLEDINEIEHDLKEYRGMINWKYKDYENLKEYDRLIVISEIMDYIITNEWINPKYPKVSLTDDINNLLNDNPNTYKIHKFKGYHTKATKPGEKLIKNFMPFAYYSKRSISTYVLFDFKKLYNIKRLYRTLLLIIKINEELKQKNKKTRIDFNYETISRYFVTKRRYEKRKKYLAYRIKQLGVYRSLIQDLELNGKSFYDIDPYLGENALIAYSEKCPYYYRPTCPFDEHCHELEKFLNYKFNIDEKGHYDFTIYDFTIHDLPDKYEEFTKIFKILKSKADIVIIHSSNRHCEPLKNLNIQKPDQILPIIGSTKKSFLIYY